MLKRYRKPPGSAKLDYPFDFAALRNGSGYSDYLEYGETISTAVATSSSEDLVVDSTLIAKNETVVVVWLTGGTLGSSYTLTVKVTTSNGRIDEFGITIYIEI